MIMKRKQLACRQKRKLKRLVVVVVNQEVLAVRALVVVRVGLRDGEAQVPVVAAVAHADQVVEDSLRRDLVMVRRFYLN
jgi:hypothetical protein